MIELNCGNCGKQLRIPTEYAGVVGRCNGCGSPVQVPGIPRLDGPPQGSPPALSSSDVSPGAPYTRDESVAIDIAVSQREMARAHKDMADQLRKATFMSRLSCGCLVAALTAPVWITAIIFFATMGFTAAVAAIATFLGVTQPIPTESVPLPVVVVNEPEPIVEEAPPTPEPLPLSKAVYSDSIHYHPDRKCAALAPPSSPSILQVALERGKQPCPICAPDEPPNPIQPTIAAPEHEPPKKSATASEDATPERAIPEETLVSVGQVGEKYHRENCADLHGIVEAMPLSKALARGLTACAKCKPEK